MSIPLAPEATNPEHAARANWPSQATIASAGEPKGAGRVIQATRIKGQTVTNRQGEILGQVDGFALDMQQGKLA